MFVRILILVISLCSAVLLNAEEMTEGIAVTPVPKGEKTCQEYELLVNGVPVPIYECRVSAVPLNQIWPGYQRPLEQTKLAGFARWEMSKKVNVEIRTKKKITSILVQPRSRKIVCQQKDQRRFSFELTKPGPIVVLINGTNHALHLFPIAMRSRPIPSRENYKYFYGPGIHDVGRLSLKSGDTVYLDAGAVVYGSIQGKNISDVHVEGPGIIDVGRLDRKAGGGAFHFENCHNVYLGGGIIQRDSNVWSTNIFNCENVTISGTALIGHWRYNSDGIDICNSRHVLVEDAFVRSFDDSLVVKGIMSYKTRETFDIKFRNCVLWCDWGRAIKTGTETASPVIKDVTFENCDIIRTTHAAMSIDHKDRAAISNMRYENIRVEMYEKMLPPVYQRSKDEKYKRQQEKRSPELFIFSIAKMNSKDFTRGSIRNIVIKDIEVNCAVKPVSIFSGYDSDHDLQGITIENLRFNEEKPVTDPKSMNLTIRKHVRDVNFNPKKL